jgi:hypothetical protein
VRKVSTRSLTRDRNRPSLSYGCNGSFPHGS